MYWQFKTRDVKADEPNFSQRNERNKKTTVYERLKALQITLPEAQPGGGWLRCRFRSRFVRTGNLVYLSGRLAKKDGKPWIGKVGEQITTLEANKPHAALP